MVVAFGFKEGHVKGSESPLDLSGSVREKQ
jgi:hypothetical protein